MKVYTMEDWKADRTFSASPGQEIAAEVYDSMLNCVPPVDLPRATADKALEDYKIPVHAGFLMGEPTSSDKEGLLYHAFGMNHYSKGNRYYYLGLSRPEPKLNGRYYYMDCMNAFVNDGLFPESEFTDDRDAIRAAADYEATLYKYEFKDGELIRNDKLYDPWDIFEKEGAQND